MQESTQINMHPWDPCLPEAGNVDVWVSICGILFLGSLAYRIKYFGIRGVNAKK
jgi:hypothetical protein